MKSARECELQGMQIRHVTAVYFCATKLEAFRGRGHDDYFSSHDLEDLIAVVDGREELVREVEDAEEDVRRYIASQVRKLLDTSAFIDALPGYLLPDAASQARLILLIESLRELAAL